MNHAQVIWWLIGAVGGFVSSLVGIGGGIIFVPALHVWSHFPIKRAIATSVACIAPIAAAGALSHASLSASAFPWWQAISLAATAIITAQLGARVMHHLPAKPIAFLFSLLLAITCLRIAGDWQWSSGTALPPLWSFPAIGLVSGFASSLLGIGGGVIMVGMMVGIWGAPMVWAITVSLTAMVPTTLSGMWAHHRRGYINWPTVIPVALPAVLCAYLGASVAHRLPQRLLEWLFCGFMVYAIARLLMRAGDR